MVPICLIALKVMSTTENKTNRVCGAKMENKGSNWSEAVEELVHEGEIDKAISLLESVVSNLQTQKNSSHNNNYLQLSTALFDLAKLYSSKGFSLKADDTHSRALLFKHDSHRTLPPNGELKVETKSAKGSVLHNEHSASIGPSEDGDHGNSSNLANLQEGCSDDDWEAVADRAPDELLSPEGLPGVSKLSLAGSKDKTPKRRGRGTFAYRKLGLYSDQQSDGPDLDDPENGAACPTSDGDVEIKNLKYGTRHVLVLAGFPDTIRTADLEKLLEGFKDRGVVIRWVNDTVALAVFKTPSDAGEACNSIRCSFTMHILNDDDVLLSSIQPRDLEPPRQRPQTSTRTAQRLIAQGMGMKLPSTSFGSRELRKQEEARKNRIVSRQNMKDDAWGDDIS